MLLLCNVFIPVAGFSGYSCSVEHFWSQELWWLHFFCLRLFNIFMIFSDSTQIWGFFNFYKLGYWYFDKVWNLQITLSCMDILTILIFQTMNMEIVLLFCIFNFFYQWPMVFSREKFCLLKFILKYFICCSYWIVDYFLFF